MVGVLKTLCISGYSCVSNVSKQLYELRLQNILTLSLPPQGDWELRDNGKGRKNPERKKKMAEGLRLVGKD